MRVGIHQPNYAPWCGYFAKIRHSDVFIFLDDVQMPRGRSYVYRTFIRGLAGPQWLSVPTSRSSTDAIRNVRFADEKWTHKHLGTLRAAYARSAHFEEVLSVIEPIYREPGDTLARFNMRMVQTIASYLGLKCRFEMSSPLKPQGQRDDRLISLAQTVGADTYLSGSSGQNYQDAAKFAAAGIQLEVCAYEPIAYDQGDSQFIPGLSILDALFHLGGGAVDLLSYPLSSDERGSDDVTMSRRSEAEPLSLRCPRDLGPRGVDS